MNDEICAHLLNPPSEKNRLTFEAQLDSNIRVSYGSDPSQIAGCDILVGGRPERKHLEANPELRALIIPFAGIPDSTRQLMKNFPQVAVHNLHYNAAPTAEMAVALLLSAAKLLVPFDRDLRQGKWSGRYPHSPSLLLENKTALVLGFGEIGQRVGRALSGLGMQVIGVRRDPSLTVLPMSAAEIYPAEALLELLPRANVLIITLPLTGQTRGLIDEQALNRLPEGAILVNVGRGSVVEQGALYQALRSGLLHSAGLDVWYNDPSDEARRERTLPADYPFHELDNVVMSPHRGGSHTEAELVRMQRLAETLNLAASGQNLPNRVDVEAGY